MFKNCLHPRLIKYSKFTFVNNDILDNLREKYKFSYKDTDGVYYYKNDNQTVQIDSSGLLLRDVNMFVDCGYCYNCRKKKANEWSVRVSEEVFINDQEGLNSVFITLTLDDEHLNPEGVDKEVLQLFFKRLRKYLTPYKSELSGNFSKKYFNSVRFKLKLPIFRDNFRYYAIGEYGTLKKRQHYHAIITGFKISKTKMRSLINYAWKFGRVDVQSCTQATVNYVSRYLVKDADLVLHPSVYEKKNKRNYPFRLVSLSFGKSYLIKYFSSILENKFLVHNNYKYLIPRTYLRWIRNIIGSDKFYNIFSKSFLEYKTFNFLKFLSETSNLEYSKNYLFDDDLYSIVNHERLKSYYLHKLSSIEPELKKEHEDYIKKKIEKSLKKLYNLESVA